MTPTQKSFAEWPLIIGILWLAQALEVSILRLPAPIGTFHLPPVIIIYLALTREWGRLTLLAFLFALMGSATVTHSTALYVASQVWTGLITKLVVTSFRLEGRPSFTLLVAGAHVVSKILLHSLLAYRGIDVDVWTFIWSTIFGALPAVLLGWFLFPAFMAWDRYFGHEPAESRELNPDIIR